MRVGPHDGINVLIRKPRDHSLCQVRAQLEGSHLQARKYLAGEAEAGQARMGREKTGSPWETTPTPSGPQFPKQTLTRT